MMMRRRIMVFSRDLNVRLAVGVNRCIDKSGWKTFALIICLRAVLTKPAKICFILSFLVVKFHLFRRG